MPLRRGTTGRRGAAGRLVSPATAPVLTIARCARCVPCGLMSVGGGAAGLARDALPSTVAPLRPQRLMFMRVGALRGTGARRQARTTAVPLALTISIPLDCPSTS
jgi:hypothetical protein